MKQLYPNKLKKKVIQGSQSQFFICKMETMMGIAAASESQGEVVSRY